MYKEGFPSRLKAARIEKGLKQAEVAEMLKVNRSTITGYETGRSEPDIETLGELITLYEVSADWLLSTQTKRKNG